MTMPNAIAPRPNQTAELTLVTPAVAYDYLSANCEQQRHIRIGHVHTLSQDLLAGRWTTTHQGIAFDSDGILIDGQHRLNAIFNSGVSVWLWVVRGLEPVRAISSVDRGKPRTMTNVLQVMGFAGANNDTVAIARGMTRILGHAVPPKLSDQAIAEFITTHADAIAFSQIVVVRNAGSALIRAVVAKASYHVSADRLIRFGRAISDQIPVSQLTESDRLARKHIGSDKSYRSGGTERGEYYGKAISLLRGYLEGRLTRISAATVDHYPLPLKTS